MFDDIMLEFNINCAKADDMYESALAIFNISKQKIISQYKGYFTEAEEAREEAEEAKKSFMEKTKEFFKKIKDAIAEAISKIVNKFKMMVAERQLLKKLEQLEVALAETTALMKLTVDEEIIDVRACFKVFKGFNKDVIQFTKAMCKKKYATREEAMKVASELEEKYDKAFEKFDIDLNGSGVTWIGTKLTDLIEMTKFDVTDFKDIMNDVQKEIDYSIALLMEVAVTEPDPVIAGMTRKTATQLSQAGMKSANKILSEMTSRFSKIAATMKSAQKQASDSNMEG